MKRPLLRWSALLSIGLVLTACQQEETEEVSGEETDLETQEETESSEDTSFSIEIDGLGDHYHTGDEVELEAVLNGETEHDHWQWYSRETDDAEWAVIPAQTTSIFSREATIDGLQVKAALLNDDHEVLAESEPVEVFIDDHHGSDEVTRRIYNGFFYNDEVEDRNLSDWEGDWQSVYPYLLSGDLDEVFEKKAAESDSMDFEDYKEYYTIGYETDVDRISIEEDTFTFYSEDGEEYAAAYEYDGYEVLTYERGNRGVRFIFERADDTEAMPQYIQFSDHIISPTESDHFHLYWGDDREELLDEVINWPTYYPSDLDTDGLVRDMLAH